MDSVCPTCHVTVRPTDYFCYNCGKNLKPKPPSVSPASLVFFFLMSALVPVAGVVLSIKYLRAQGNTYKMYGIAGLIVTGVSLLFTVQFTISFMQEFERQLNAQLMGGLGGF